MVTLPRSTIDISGIIVKRDPWAELTVFELLRAHAGCRPSQLAPRDLSRLLTRLQLAGGGLQPKLSVWFDPEGSGLVDRTQLFVGLAALCNDQPQDRLRAMFEIVDAGDSGQIDRMGVQLLLASLAPPGAEPAEVTKLSGVVMCQVDRAESGTVSFGQLIQWAGCHELLGWVDGHAQRVAAGLSQQGGSSREHMMAQLAAHLPEEPGPAPVEPAQLVGRLEALEELQPVQLVAKQGLLEHIQETVADLAGSCAQVGQRSHQTADADHQREARLVAREKALTEQSSSAADWLATERSQLREEQAELAADQRKLSEQIAAVQAESERSREELQAERAAWELTQAAGRAETAAEQARLEQLQTVLSQGRDALAEESAAVEQLSQAVEMEKKELAQDRAGLAAVAAKDADRLRGAAEAAAAERTADAQVAAQRTMVEAQAQVREQQERLVQAQQAWEGEQRAAEQAIEREKQRLVAKQAEVDKQASSVHSAEMLAEQLKAVTAERSRLQTELATTQAQLQRAETGRLEQQLALAEHEKQTALTAAETQTALRAKDEVIAALEQGRKTELTGSQAELDRAARRVAELERAHEAEMGEALQAVEAVRAEVKAGELERAALQEGMMQLEHERHGLERRLREAEAELDQMRESGLGMEAVSREREKAQGLLRQAEQEAGLVRDRAALLEKMQAELAAQQAMLDATRQQPEPEPEQEQEPIASRSCSPAGPGSRSWGMSMFRMYAKAGKTSTRAGQGGAAPLFDTIAASNREMDLSELSRFAREIGLMPQLIKVSSLRFLFPRLLNLAGLRKDARQGWSNALRCAPAGVRRSCSQV